MKQFEGCVTSPKGFKAAGVEANIKYKNRNDVAVIYSEVPCVTAGVFTSNVVKAAPVMWDKKIVEAGKAQAVVVNSGIANACTGKQGMDICEKEAECAAKIFGISKEEVLVGSTGVIGFQIPEEKIVAGIEMASKKLGSSFEDGMEALAAIMTTDTVKKYTAVEFEVGGKTCTIGAMTKGSGMIHPNMCTMLGFFTTDVAISKEMLDKAVKADVIDSFNMISVDGDTSTNDTYVILANGMAGNKIIDSEGEDFESFKTALAVVSKTLAKKMAADGEGANCLIECHVYNADTKANARTLSKSVICSSLTKAAIFGHDANWGRILCALGYSGAQFDPENVDLFFGDGEKKIKIFSEGKACDYSEEEATEILSKPAVILDVDMHMGSEEATAWGCDLSFDYVKINADYRS